MSTQPRLDLASDSVFDHVRPSDGEVVGYVRVTDKGDFVPFDLLHHQVGPAGDLVAAEQLLEATGLALLARPYLLEHDGRRLRVGIKELTRHEVVLGPVPGDVLDEDDAAVDLTARWTLPLPVAGLVPLHD